MINKGHGPLSAPSISFAGDMNSFTLSLAKKCERLATAEYLVTSFLSDNEPLKARLRSLALDLMRDASLVRSGTIAGEGSALENLLANIGDTLALLELAFIGGLISEMNFSILKREYVSLRDATDIKKASRDSRTDSILGDKFFGTPEIASHPHLAPVLSPRSDLKKFEPRVSPLYTTASAQMSDRNPKGQQKSPRTDLGNFGLRSVLGDSSKTPQGHIQKSPRSDLENLGQRSVLGGAPNIQRDSRRTRIIKLIKDKREVAIKDIIEHFPDLSEKTIQRELVSLTDSNVLKKSGERRWSRYSLRERL